MRMVVVAVVGLLLAGCAHEYLYAPVEPGLPAHPVAAYRAPPGAPRGEVYVTSFGFTEVQIGAARTATMLHTRLAVSNLSSELWTVDGRAQRLVVDGESIQSPVFLNTNAGPGPVYRLHPGGTAAIDLYYAPVPALDPGYVGGFALDWTVATGGGVLSKRTLFRRYEAQPVSYASYPSNISAGLGSGAHWWYDPSYFYPTQHPPVPLAYFFPPGGLRVGSRASAPLAAEPSTASTHAPSAHPVTAQPPLRATPVHPRLPPPLGPGWHNEGGFPGKR